MPVVLIAFDCGPERQMPTMLDALGLAWATLTCSPPGTVVAIHSGGCTWSMKTTDRLEVVEVPF